MRALFGEVAILKHFLHFLTRFLTRVFFRRLVVVGQERIPQSGPILALANHVNGLIDPLLVFSVLPRLPRSLAKSTLWDIKALAWLLDLGGVIPVYRRIDRDVDTSQNERTFELCCEALSRGDTVVLFPEGIAHDFPELQPLRTGAARIALEAEARYGPLGVMIQPIGLTFDDKYTFRSNALIIVGEPFPLFDEDSPFAGRDLDDAPDLVRDLTDRIDAAIRQLTLNYETWEAASRFAEAAEVVLWREDTRLRVLDLVGEAHSSEPVDGRSTLLHTYQLRRALEEIYPSLVEELPAETAAVVEAVTRYHDLLEGAGLRHELVATSAIGKHRLGSAIRWGIRILAELLVLFPLSAVGFVLNLLPYPLPRLVARRSGDRHLAATYKVYTSLVIYPAFWLLEALLVGWLLGFGWFALVLLLAPLTGYVALRFYESGSDLLRRLMTLVKLRRSAQRQEIEATRAEVDRRIDALMARIGSLAS